MNAVRLRTWQAGVGVDLEGGQEKRKRGGVILLIQTAHLKTALANGFAHSYTAQLNLQYPHS